MVSIFSKKIKNIHTFSQFYKPFYITYYLKINNIQPKNDWYYVSNIFLITIKL
jgi:hypothetical protein